MEKEGRRVELMGKTIWGKMKGDEGEGGRGVEEGKRI